MLNENTILNLENELYIGTGMQRLLLFGGSEIFLFFAIFILFVFCIYNSRSKTKQFPLLQIPAIVISVMILGLSIFLLNNTPTTEYYLPSILQSHFEINGMFLIIKKFILFLMLIIFLLCLNYTKKNNKITYEFSTLLLISSWSMCLLISCVDLFAIYLIIELQSFCFYLLTATKSKSNNSTEAGLKYFILGSFSSGLLLFGISLLYGFTNLTNLKELRMFFISFANNNNYDYGMANINYIIMFSLILIIVSILFKFGIAPFHMYVPDVYSGAPTIVTMLFLIIQKFVILIVYLNLYFNIFKYYFNQINYLIVICILFSIILGSITALSQYKVKRLIAYSAIVNGGYLLIGVILGTLDGISASLLFLFIYIILIITLLTIFINTKTYYNNKKLSNFNDLKLLKKSSIILTVSFTLVMFSIAGIPPLAGFYGKLFLFIAAIKENSYALAIISIIFTVVTAYYYIKLIKIMFFENDLKFGFFKQITKIDAYIIAIGTLFNVLFFVMPKIFFSFINLFLLKYYFYY